MDIARLGEAKEPMMIKHTIKGHHGHMFELKDIKNIPAKDRSVKDIFQKICVPLKEAVDAELDVENLRARERVSKKYKVCIWCLNPKNKISGTLGSFKKGKRRVVAYECEKCDGHKPIKTTQKD